MPFTLEEASAAEEAGVDTMKIRFDPALPELAAAMRAAAPNTFMAFSVPLVAAANETEAVRFGYEAMKLSADADMCQWQPSFVKAATDPVPCRAGAAPEHLDGWSACCR